MKIQLHDRFGGMPKVVSTYIRTKNYAAASNEQNLILNGFRDDFQKYAKKTDWACLQIVFKKLANFVAGSHLKYSAFGENLSPIQIRRALELLEHAMLISRIYPTHTDKLPLSAAAKVKQFKLAFLDIGLLHFMLGFDWSKVSPDADLTDICEGKFAEQFVAQELTASRSINSRYAIHYWNRPKADAEVDYVIEYQGQPTPLEVKSGLRGKLRSLSQYIAELKPKHAFVTSQRNREHLPDAELVPLYVVSRIL